MLEDVFTDLIREFTELAVRSEEKLRQELMQEITTLQQTVESLQHRILELEEQN